MGAKLSPRVLSRRLSSLILIFYMFQLTKCTCNWYSGCKFKRLRLCADCVISSHYALSFVFSNGNIARRFPFFKWNAFNTVRFFLGEQTLNFLSCKLVKAALTGLDYGETSDLFKCFPELTRWCFHHQKSKTRILSALCSPEL